MGAVLSCCACGALCTTLQVCCSCAGCLLGGGGGGDVPTDVMVGKLRSMTIMIISLVLGLLTQYYWADSAAEKISGWGEDCDGNSACIGNSAINRMSMTDAVFFFILGLGAHTGSLFNNKYWDVKFLLWVVLGIGAIFLPNHVLNGYVWVARFGAFFFSILQQIVLIDIAYDWNDAFVSKASELGEDGGGRKFLVILVAICTIMFVGSITVLGLLFHYFSGCADTNAILSITLVLCLVCTGVQLSGEEGNLLASSIVTAYCVFLAFSAIGRNPDSECNPFVGNSQNATSIVIGLILTLLSLIWICANTSTSITKLLGGEEPETTKISVDNANKGGLPITGQTPFIAQGGVSPDTGAIQSPTRHGGTSSQITEPDDNGDGWKFNVVMVLLAMYFGMMLTNWGVVQKGAEETFSDPKNGQAAMWLTAASQWVCLLLYLWTLMAPKLFPDRDFS